MQGPKLHKTNYIFTCFCLVRVLLCQKNQVGNESNFFNVGQDNVQETYFHYPCKSFCSCLNHKTNPVVYKCSSQNCPGWKLLSKSNFYIDQLSETAGKELPSQPFDSRKTESLIFTRLRLDTRRNPQLDLYMNFNLDIIYHSVRDPQVEICFSHTGLG